MEGRIRSDDSRCFLAPVWSKFEVFEYCDLVENRLDRPKKKCEHFSPASQRPRKGRRSKRMIRNTHPSGGRGDPPCFFLCPGGMVAEISAVCSFNIYSVPTPISFATSGRSNSSRVIFSGTPSVSHPLTV